MLLKSVRDSDFVTVFKSRLKTFLFFQAFSLSTARPKHLQSYVLMALYKSLLSRPNKVGLRCTSVYPSVRLSICPSANKKFLRFGESKDEEVIVEGICESEIEELVPE